MKNAPPDFPAAPYELGVESGFFNRAAASLTD